ncbi:MAG: CDGSH iron-sulfur domain-containing protein [Gemmatimonadota bacterium]
MISDNPRDQPHAPVSTDGPITITVKPSGTIVIHGEAHIVDTEGNALVIPPFKQPGVIKLCGCGRSANRPFCDGSHKKPVP